MERRVDTIRSLLRPFQKKKTRTQNQTLRRSKFSFRLTLTEGNFSLIFYAVVWLAAWMCTACWRTDTTISNTTHNERAGRGRIQNKPNDKTTRRRRRTRDASPTFVLSIIGLLYFHPTHTHDPGRHTQAISDHIRYSRTRFLLSTTCV